MAHITFQGESCVEEDDLSLSLLEISLRHGIPHTHACGGNARCSTCRVMVMEDEDQLTPRNELEQRLADEKGLEPNIRLACQARVKGDVKVRRLVLDPRDVDLVLSQTGQTTGREAKVAVMFSDIRGFTTFTEQHLAYDVVHCLNRYFQAMGDAIRRHDGYIDKYIGDGIMAIFGLQGANREEACGQAVLAGLQMLAGLQEVNDYLVASFGDEYGLRIGIGIHYGSAIIGEFGHPRKMQFTALGDTVNVASRVESATKEHRVPLLITDSVAKPVAGLVRCRGPFETPLKGKSDTFGLYEVLGLEDNCRLPQHDLHRRLDETLSYVVTRQHGPLFLRLAYHDAATYSTDGRGGANGSIRLDPELNREDNLPLRPAIEALATVKDELPELSWADLIAAAGAFAVEQAGGPSIPLPMGRSDAFLPDPEDREPKRDATADELRQRFGEMGFDDVETVALMGAHTFGRVYGVPFTGDLFAFTNSFYKLLLTEEAEARAHLLDCDNALVADPEYRRLVVWFASEEPAFHQEFAKAYRKMTLLGTGLG